MSTRTCETDGCGRQHYGNGLCRSHYMSRWRVNRSALCSLLGCGKPRHARTWCITHYSRWRKTGSPGSTELYRQQGSGCAVSECARPYEGSGYCKLHRGRWKKHGDPEHVAVGGPPIGQYAGARASAWRGDSVGYMGMHECIRKDFGPANAHDCVDCGTPAAHWSYDHTDPSERVDETVGCVYSSDAERYEPRCASCHWWFDAAYRTAP